VPPAKKRGVGVTLDVLRFKISDLEVRVAEQNQQISALQLGNTETRANLHDVEERAITVSSELDEERDAHATTKREWNEERDASNSTHLLQSANLFSLLDDIDVLQLQNEQLQNEHEQLGEEKAASKTKENNLRRKNTRLSATFVSAGTLNNPNISVHREDKNATMRERFDHIFTHDAKFKKLKDERKGKVIADVVWDEALLGSKAKDALFSKASTNLRATHFDTIFLLEEIDKSGAEMNRTGV
jgi:chromosome segregation ATPase